MKKNFSSFILIVFLILFIPLTLAQEVTYEEYLVNPTYEDFALLSPIEQQQYIAQATDFSTSPNYDIAYDYFMQGAISVNENKDAFQRFMKVQGVEIEVLGNINQFMGNTLLVTRDAEIDLLSFADQYSFKVDELGDLILISNGAEHVIIGTVISESAAPGEKPSLSIVSGSIDGYEIVEGSLRLEGDKIIGKSSRLGNFIFQDFSGQYEEGGFVGGEGEGIGTEANFIFDPKNKEIEFLDNSYTPNEPVYFIDRASDITITNNLANNAIVFVKKGDTLFLSRVQYENDKARRIDFLKKGGSAFLEGVSFLSLVEEPESVSLCYTETCAVPLREFKSNFFFFGDQAVEAGGKDFAALIDKQAILFFKEQIKSEEYKSPTLWAESLFVGSTRLESSNYYDRIGMFLVDGEIQIEKKDKRFITKINGQVGLQNGYWSIVSDGSRVQKLKGYNPFIGIDENGKIINGPGRDVVPMTVDFTMDNGEVQTGYQFIDEYDKPDIFSYPFRYTGIMPNGMQPQSEEEFFEYFKFNLDLLRGQPLDFREGRSAEEVKFTNEFVCVDVVASAYKMTTRVDILEDKERLIEGYTDDRKNDELYTYFLKSPRFNAKEYSGEDFYGSDEVFRGDWGGMIGKIFDTTQIQPGNPDRINWEEEYGLEHGKMQFIMFEKQHITYDTKKKAYIKDGGSPKYHLVPVFWGPLRDAQGEEITDEETGEVIEDWITVQAPGECRPEGVCEVALSKYVYETRCSPKDLEAKESCYGYYGVREVVKPKFVLK